MKKITVILLLSALLLTCGCAQIQTKTVFALDTVIEFKLSGAVPDGAEALIFGCEKIFSKTDKDSELYKLNQTEDAKISDDLQTLILRSLAISDVMDSFDISLGALTDLWDGASEKGVPPDQSDIAAALAASGYGKLSLADGILKKPSETKLDLGACAKGYIAEKTVKWLADKGAAPGLVIFGGSVAVAGDKPDGSGYKIGIRSPDKEGVAGYTVIHSGYLSTSGDYERYFEYEGKRYHHIIDPRTGSPSESSVRSCTVISEDGVLSDALSTALFVSGKEGLKKLEGSGFEFEAILIFDNGTVLTTKNAGFVITDPRYSAYTD